MGYSAGLRTEGWSGKKVRHRGDTLRRYGHRAAENRNEGCSGERPDTKETP